MKQFLIAASLVITSSAGAAWPTDADVDVPVADIESSFTPNVVSDGQRGVFVVFAPYDAGVSSLGGGTLYSSG